MSVAMAGEPRNAAVIARTKLWRALVPALGRGGALLALGTLALAGWIALALASRVGLLDQGRLVCLGTVEEFNAAGDPRVAAFRSLS